MDNLKQLLFKHFMTDYLSPSNDNELYYACSEGDLEKVKKLVEYGANVNHFKNNDTKKKNCLMVACKKGHIDVVKYLISKGANIHAKTSSIEMNALHCATRCKNLELCKYLVELGLDPNEANINRWKAIHYAALYGTPEIIEYYVEKGSDINAKSESDLTPLSLAARNDKINNVRCLLKLGADPNIPDKSGATPVMFTCKAGDLQVLKILVEEGNADINLTDMNGNNALVEADKMNMVECALYCWKLGCDPISLKKTKGLGPLRWIRPRMLDCEKSPSARYGCASIAIGSKMYVYGGNGLHESHRHHDPEKSLSDNAGLYIHSSLGDLWVVDLDKVHTTKIHPGHNKSKFFMSNERAGAYIKALDDGLTVISTDLNDEHSEPSSIQSNIPFTEEDGIGYFEVHVICSGTKDIVTIGLTDEKFKLDRLPGWVTDTYGYHGDDGQVFHNNGQGKLWGPRYSNGDIVGCGIIFKTGEVFFTKNGEWLGVAYKFAQQKQYYPTVGFRNPKAEVKINFGQHPFEFEFEVPTLVWEKPRTFGVPPRSSAHPRMFLTNDEKILLIPDLEYSRHRIIGFFDPKRRRWELTKASGIHPILLPDAHYAHCKTRLFALNNTQSLDRTYFHFSFLFYMLDIENKVWYQIYPTSEINHNVFGKYMDNIEYICTKLKEHNNIILTSANDNLLLIGDDFSLEVNPITFEYVEKKVRGSAPTVKSCTYLPLENNVVVFGGWDDNRKRQDGDVTIFDANEATWYKPHVFGCVPRPRNFHSACVVKSKKMSKYIAEFADVADTDETNSDTFLVHSFGWNGKNFIDDFDILCLDSKWKADPLINCLDSNEYDLVFKFPSGEKITSFKIIVASRSSYFKRLLTEEHNYAGVTEIDINDTPYHLFYAMMRYLHSDLTDQDISVEESRDFVAVIERYAPEHATRVSESIIITWLVERSSMSEDMEWAFNNSNWSDIQFEIDGKTLYGHKAILCEKSEYFRAMLKGGLMESDQSVIKITAADYLSFYIVLKYIYTGKMDYDNLSDNIITVFELSYLYSIKSLIELLQNVLSYNLTDDNIFSLTLLAMKYQADKLKNSCVKYICKNNLTIDLPDQESKSMIEDIVNEYKKEKALKKKLREEELLREEEIDKQELEYDRNLERVLDEEEEEE